MRKKFITPFTKTVTGIPERHYVSFRRDFTYNVSAAGAASWNSLICGNALVLGPQNFQQFLGNSTTAITPATGALDINGCTGVSQWNTFYNRYQPLASKIIVDIQNLSDEPLQVTVVPTYGTRLSNYGGVAFDSNSIDPGELPYAKRKVTNGTYSTGGANLRIKNYITTKRMLGVKDMRDVDYAVIGNWDQAFGAINPTGPYLDIFWNIVVQNGEQNSDSNITKLEPSYNVRVQVIYYVMMADRLVIPT